MKSASSPLSAPVTSVLDDAVALAKDVLALSRDSLLANIRFANRPLAQLPARIQTDRVGCMTDGREALFSAAFVLDSFNGKRQIVARAWLHMIVHCLLRHPFPAAGVDPLTWSVACDLACGCVLRELECDAIRFEDSERDALLDIWVPRAKQPTASAFYALLKAEGLSQEELANIEIVIGMDSHELWFDTPEGVEEAESLEQQQEARQHLEKRWEEVASATEMDIQRDASNASCALAEQLRGVHASTMSLDELLRIYAAPREVMSASDDEFDYIYYTYGLRDLGGIALVEPLEYSESPRLRDFCIAIDTSGSCSGPLVRSFVAKVCGMLLGSDSIGEQTRIWLVQCDCQVQDVQQLCGGKDIAALLANLELKGFGGTDFGPVFSWMDNKLDCKEVGEWEALVYFTDGQGVFPDEAPPYDTAFVFVDDVGSCPAWATKVLVYSDELEET